MEEIIKKVEQILNQYAQECMGNRLNQFTFVSLKNVILGEIAKYKPGENKKVDNTCMPILDKSNKSTEQKIIRK